MVSIPQVDCSMRGRQRSPCSARRKSPYLDGCDALYLAKALAVSTIMHGVFLDVLEIGVLLTGGSAMSKSELALRVDQPGPWPGCR